MSKWWLLQLCGLLLHTIASSASPEQELLDWAGQKGWTVNFKIGRACEQCPRGALAARAFAKGDVVASLPGSAALELGDGSTAEQAYRLLERLEQDEAFSKAWAPFVASLPQPDEIFGPEMFSDAHLAELQTSELERLVRLKQVEAEGLFKAKAPGPAELTLERLKYMTVVLRTRTFNLLGKQLMAPVLDMVNNSEEGPNMDLTDAGGNITFLAGRAIEEGEELTFQYRRGTLHRSDASLFIYGFLEEREQPLLCAVDLPTHNAADPWVRTIADDSSLAPAVARTWPGRWVVKREHARLAALLAAMPTTEQQDEALLAGGSLTSWQQRMLVQFRLQRKRALRLALDRLETACGLQRAAQQQQGAGQPLECPGGAAAAAGGALRPLLAESAGALLYLGRLLLSRVQVQLRAEIVVFAVFGFLLFKLPGRGLSG